MAVQTTSLRESSELIDQILKANEMIRDSDCEVEVRTTHTDESVYFTLKIPRDKIFHVTGKPHKEISNMFRAIADIIDLNW